MEEVEEVQRLIQEEYKKSLIDFERRKRLESKSVLPMIGQPKLEDHPAYVREGFCDVGFLSVR